MKLIVALMLLCISVLAEQQVVEWSISPNRTGCFAQKLVGNDIKLVGLEWPEFVKKHEYCYIKKWYGWSKVKTAKMDETGWDWPSGGAVVVPVHIPPYRNGSSGLIIVSPTISGDAHKK